MLSDLDVVAFSYAPLPYTADNKIGLGEGPQSPLFLMNNPIENNAPVVAGTGFWSLIKNQIFLGEYEGLNVLALNPYVKRFDRSSS